MFLGDDVIHFVGEESDLSGEQAVIARPVSALLDRTAHARRDTDDAHGAERAESTPVLSITITCSMRSSSANSAHAELAGLLTGRMNEQEGRIGNERIPP
jgi:hypothetical protein